MPSHPNEDRGFGAKRELLPGHVQTNLGPCERCGQNVWVKDDTPLGDRALLHKFCRSLEER